MTRCVRPPPQWPRIFASIHFSPFTQLLTALIDSPSYDHATPQLLLTLQYAPDKVDEIDLEGGTAVCRCLREGRC